MFHVRVIMKHSLLQLKLRNCLQPQTFPDIENMHISQTLACTLRSYVFTFIDLNILGACIRRYVLFTATAEASGGNTRLAVKKKTLATLQV